MKAPKYPDPAETAKAQAGYNLDTAVSSQFLNMVDSSNPWGDVDYTQNGSVRYRSSDGSWVDIPTFEQTTTFSPEQQAIFDASQSAQGNLANIANEQSERIQQILSDPFQFDNQDAANWAYDLGANRLDPRFAREEEALRARLTNQGIREGTAAWDSAMTRLGESKNDAYNQLTLTGRGQAFSEALASRNQPVNELTALLTGSQVSNPASMSGPTPQTGVGGVDYSGLVGDKYNADMNAYGAKMGGLFGLLGAGAQGAFMLSDARAKEDIRRIGETDDGLPIYSFSYLGDDKKQMGVVAQEVDKLQPEASGPTLFGLRTVDYSKVH